MKINRSSFKAWFSEYKWILLGCVLAVAVLFSNMVHGYQLSYTNANYAFPPFDSTGTAFSGPLLTDVADSLYPGIVRSYYSEDGFALWESDAALGRPLDSVPKYMDPMNWVYVFPMGAAIVLKLLTEFAVGFLAMFLYMRSLGIGKYAAALTGAIYTFSAAIVMWMGWSHSDVAVWAPMLFFAIEKLMQTRQVRYMLLVTLTVYVMLIVGMPTYTAYFMYMAGLYIVIFTVKRYWHEKRNIFVVGGLFALGVILAVVVSLPYTITLLDKVGGNGYLDSRTSMAEAKLGWEYLRTLLFPYQREGLPLHANESTLYVGTLAVVLLPFSLCHTTAKKRNWFFIAATVVLFLLIFTDLLTPVFTKIPMINSSLKIRVIVLLMFTLATLTGITLNDCLVNKDYYRRKPWLLALAAVWIAVALLVIGRDLLVPRTKLTAATGLLMAALAACVVLLIKKDIKIIYMTLAVLVVGQSVSFAADYLPWIDADAPVIPEPTDSVSYMMENTEEERIVGLGGWTFFPNTPTYYDLNDIRTHGFEATNPDIREYYTAIDDQSYASNTRVAFMNIDEMELLKYIGVKYLYGESFGVTVGTDEPHPHATPYGYFVSHTELTQTVQLEADLRELRIPFATYATVPQSGGTIEVSLCSASGETVISKTLVVNDLRDNEEVVFAVESTEPLPAGEYVLRLAIGDIGEDTVTVWVNEAPGYTLRTPAGDIPGCVGMSAVYDTDDYRIVYQGEDGLTVAQLNEFSPKAELMSAVKVYDSEAAVLEAMKAAYLPHTAMVVGTDASLGYDRPLAASEGVRDCVYTDNRVTVRVDCETERLLVLNDYYHTDWHAYINGEEVPIERVNYLVRGVRVPAGKDITVEFRYEPARLYSMMAVSAIGLLLVIALLACSRPLQRLVDTLCIVRSEESAPAQEEGSTPAEKD